MIGFDCAGKVQSQASCSNARCVQISNARFEWIGSRIAQRVSVVEIYYFDIGNAKRSCRGLFRWAYQIPIRRPSMVSSSIVSTFSHRVLNSNIFAGDRAISIGGQILGEFGSRLLTTSSCSICNGRATYRVQAYITSSYQPPPPPPCHMSAANAVARLPET